MKKIMGHKSCMCHNGKNNEKNNAMMKKIIAYNSVITHYNRAVTITGFKFADHDDSVCRHSAATRRRRSPCPPGPSRRRSRVALRLMSPPQSSRYGSSGQARAGPGEQDYAGAPIETETRSYKS
jgi:hypothetical protein